MDKFAVIAVVAAVLMGALVVFLVYRCGAWCVKGVASCFRGAPGPTEPQYTVVPDEAMRLATIERFLLEIAAEKPVRFTTEQLAGFTRNYSERLGAGGFGTVYRGALPNGLAVAVKVLHSWLDQRKTEEQFMAEVSTIGRTHHINLVRLFGFCFDDRSGGVRALVYEHMEHGALDDYLFDPARADVVGMSTVAAVAAGVARGLRYLHEECHKKIIHYDVKAGNVLLDGGLTPKVADFGLARLVNHTATHASVSGMRGTPGYAAPELWRQIGVTEKCDVYSFGMLLLELIGRRRNFVEAAPESQQFFPRLAWTRYETGQLMELLTPRGAGAGGDDPGAAAGADETRRALAERMCKVAFWCVQQQPEARPSMGKVVKMLEGETDIPPPANPFQHMMAAPPNLLMETRTSSGSTVWATTNGISDGSNEMTTLTITN